MTHLATKDVIRRLVDEDLLEGGLDAEDCLRISSYLKTHQLTSDELKDLYDDDQMPSLLERALRSEDSALVIREIAIEVMCQFFRVSGGRDWLRLNGSVLLVPIFENFFDDKRLEGYEATIRFLCEFAKLESCKIIESIKSYVDRVSDSQVLRLRLVELLIELFLAVDPTDLEGEFKRTIRLQLEDEDLVSQAGTLSLFSKLTRLMEGRHLQLLQRIGVLTHLVSIVRQANESEDLKVEPILLKNTVNLLFSVVRTDDGYAMVFSNPDDIFEILEGLYDRPYKEMQDEIASSLIYATSNVAYTIRGLEGLLNRKHLLHKWLEYGYVSSNELKATFFKCLSLVYSNHSSVKVSSNTNTLLMQLYNSLKQSESSSTMAFLFETLRRSNIELNEAILSLLQALVHFQWGLTELSKCPQLITWLLDRSKDVRNLQLKYDVLKSAFKHPNSKQTLESSYHQIAAYLKTGVHVTSVYDTVAIKTEHH